MGRVFLRMNDEEMAARIREADDPEATANMFMDTCEALIERKQWYDAGAVMMDSALRRIMVVVERVCGEPDEAGDAA